jgi:hypothetical protein
MKHSLLFLVLLGGVAFADGGPDKAALWTKFPVKDITLGTPLSALPAQGFTCGPDKGNSMPTCVKFLDERCHGQKITVRAIAMNFPAPKGKGCVYDSVTGGTLLDAVETTVPMSLVAVKGTDTKAPRVYEIQFDYAVNVLGKDTKLGKALIAKYGTPVLDNAPIQMAWQSGDVQLQAVCASVTNESGQYCYQNVSDSQLLVTERAVKEAADRKAQEHDAPGL